MVKVVVADNDIHVARFEGRVMESLGYCPILCRDGSRALAILEDNHDVALLITDMRMPIMSGRDLVTELRTRDPFQRLPIILTSGFSRGDEVLDLLDIGVTCFLSKPIEVEDLKNYARSLVADRVGTSAGNKPVG